MKLTFRALALCDFISFFVSCYHLSREIVRVFISFLISAINTTIFQTASASNRLRRAHSPFKLYKLHKRSLALRMSHFRVNFPWQNLA